MNASVLSEPNQLPGNIQPITPAIIDGTNMSKTILVKDISPSLVPFFTSAAL